MAEKYFAQPGGTTAQQHFSAVPMAEIERSRFDRSHGRKTTLDAGFLTPVYVDEVLPGDSFHMSSTTFARLATPLKPIMDNLYLDIHFFFVPYRLVWDNWEFFCGERKNPTDDPETKTVPQTVLPLNLDSLKLGNHLGIPNQGLATTISVSALPFRCYSAIYNDWYRDQNLMAEVTISHGDGPDNYAAVNLLKRNRRHDYFTSCLPWPQKGDPVFLPLGTIAPVVKAGAGTPTFHTATDATVRSIQGTYSSADAQEKMLGFTGSVMTTTGNFIWDNPALQADLTTATAATINDIRTAFQIQKLLERDARGGTRYIEIVLSHFGVHSDDARLQRPEYLGGGTSMININPIAQTVDTVDAPTGSLAAFATGVTKGGFSKSFTEHGLIMGLVSARSDQTYQNGLDRFWSRRTRYDFYWPSLAHLGEQAVLNKEIFAQGAAADDEVFGYQERYAEYRYKNSQVTGKFASNDPESLDVWHLANDFGTLPTLSVLWMMEDPPIDRICAVTTEPHFLLDIWFNLQCQRPMPVYSVPGLIDHF